MASQKLTKQEYLDTINEEIRSADFFVEGMEVIDIAPGHESLDSLGAFLWEGPDYIAQEMEAIVAKISQQYLLSS